MEVYIHFNTRKYILRFAIPLSPVWMTMYYKSGRTWSEEIVAYFKMFA